MKKVLFGLGILLFSTVLLVFIPVNICFPENTKDVRLAIIPGQGERAPEEVVSTNLEVRLSHLSGMKLVERTQIRTVLEELQLGASGMMDAKNAPRLGQLLSADILLFVEKIPGAVQETYRIRLLESQTGIILATTLATQQALSEGLAAVMEIITSAIAKHHVPMTDRHFIGILGFKSEEPGSTLDGTAEALRMFLDVDLASAPHVVMLDREHLRHLQTEKNLTGLELNLKSSAFLLDGGIKYAPGRKRLLITMFLRPMDGGMEERMTMTVPTGNIALTRQTITRDILTKLNLTIPTDKTIDSDREAELFLAKVPFFLSGGDYETAVRHAEVAYALKPNQETRYWAARAWYALGWTLAKTIQLSDTFSSGVIRVQMIKSTRVAGGQEFWGAPQKMKNMKPRRVSGTRQTVTPARVSQSAGQSYYMTKKRSLSAFIRAYTLIYELSRFHAQEYAAGIEKNLEIPDPTKFPKFPSIRSYITAEVPLSSRDDDAYESKKLYSQLTDMRNDIISFQQEFYARHYGSTDKGQASYWDTWRKKKEMVSNSYKHSSTQRTVLIRQAVDAFIRMNQGNLEAGIKGLLDVLELPYYFHTHDLSEEEIRLYKELTGHQDPFVRIMAYRRLMRVDLLESSRKQLEIFIQEFLYGHPFWKLKDQDLIPKLLTPAVQRLAISERKTMIQFVRQIIEPLIRHNDAAGLVAWRDIFWPYVNGLGFEGLKVDQSRVVQKAIQVLDAYEGKGAEGVLEQVLAWIEGRNVKNDKPVKDKELSGKIKRLRTELEIQLVKMGLKKEMDPQWNKSLIESPVPSYIRQLPEIEPPRLGEPMNARVVQLIRKTKKQRDVFFQGTTVSVDKEGNAQISTYNPKVQPVRRNSRASIYTIREMASGFPIGRNIWGIVRARGNREGLRISENILIDGNDVYVVSEERSNNKLKTRLYRHNFAKAGKKYLMGESSVDIKTPGAFYVTAMASGENDIYVGTLGGVIKYSKHRGKVVTHVSTVQYLPYFLPGKNAGQFKALHDDQVVHFTEDNGFPDNNVLSLAYYNGKLYVGTGPIEFNKLGLTGKSGFAVFDPEQGTYDLIASSSALKKNNGLDGGAPYQIQSILMDEKRLCLWLAVAGNKKRNGIWRYDFETGDLKHVVREDSSVQKLVHAGDSIMYMLYGTGLARYNPESRTKVWLLGYQHDAQSVPPKDYKGDALYGYPQTSLWPAVLDGDRIVTLNWSGGLISLAQQDASPVIMDKTSDNRPLGKIKYITRHQGGILAINAAGQVFLIISK